MVTPVVVSPIKATSDGMMSIYGNAQPSLIHHATRGLPKNTIRKKGIAIMLPRRNPLVLKFGVGIQGSRIGKMIRLATITARTARAAIGPLEKYNRT